MHPDIRRQLEALRGFVPGSMYPLLDIMENRFSRADQWDRIEARLRNARLIEADDDPLEYVELLIQRAELLRR